MCTTCVSDGINRQLWSLAHGSPKGRLLAKAKSLKEKLITWEALNATAQAHGNPPPIAESAISGLRSELMLLAREI
jgi:hypothetical protein